ncbi:hypothetical protein NFI96_001027, partial [Prochilodus magdalenae]
MTVWYDTTAVFGDGDVVLRTVVVTVCVHVVLRGAAVCQWCCTNRRTHGGHHCSLEVCNDETEFRNFIVWLEDQKIRHYKIEDRGNLRNIPSSEWPKSFEKYLQDVGCPFSTQERQESVDWLLGLAVRFEYGDN